MSKRDADKDDRPHILALIPARGGSKGVPRKNILPVNGKPLISYTIRQALESCRITRTIVSTDDEEIALISRDWGAETPFMRPAELATDVALDIDTFVHALEWLRDNEGYQPDLVVHLRATAPVRRVEVIDEAIGTLLSTAEADSLRTVALADQTPYKMWRLDGEYIEPIITLPEIPEAHSASRQSLPKVYWQNCYVDVVRPAVILEKRSMVGERVLGMVIEEPTFDIDHPEDVPRAEEALRRLEEGLPLRGDEAGERHPN